MNRGNDRSGLRRAGCAWRVARLLAGILAVPLVLGSCSVVPEWADPTGWFAEGEAPSKTAVSADQARYLQSADFPNLASVPDSAPRVTPLETRTRIQESLAADRANAEYSGERLVGEAQTQAPSQAPSRGASTSPPQASPVPPTRVPQATQAQAAKVSQAASPAGAPPVPKITGELVGQGQAPSSSSPARPQVQTPMTQIQVVQTGASAAAGRTQLRFPQFDGAAGARSAPAAVGTQLVAVIYFGHGSWRLDANDRSVLRDIVALRRQRGGVIRVIGHASARTGVVDQVKHRMTNFEMSLKRANATAAVIMALGVAKDKVRAEARGAAQPVFHEFMLTGEAGNRRAEIFLEY